VFAPRFALLFSVAFLKSDRSARSRARRVGDYGISFSIAFSLGLFSQRKSG